MPCLHPPLLAVSSVSPSASLSALLLILLVHRDNEIGRWRKEFALAPLRLYRLDCALCEAMGLPKG